MRKRVAGRLFSRSTTSRRALFRALVRAFVAKGSINTTFAKAKTLQGRIDKLAAKARKATVASQRGLLAELGNDRGTVKLLAARFADGKSRLSGQTRIISLPARKGDNAAMARIEWVDKDEKVEKVGKVEKVKPARKTRKEKTSA